MLPLDRLGKEIEYHGAAHVRKAQQRALLVQQVTVIKGIALRQLPGRKGQALHGHGLGVGEGKRLIERLPLRFLLSQQDGVLIAGGVQIVLQLLRLFLQLRQRLGLQEDPEVADLHHLAHALQLVIELLQLRLPLLGVIECVVVPGVVGSGSLLTDGAVDAALHGGHILRGHVEGADAAADGEDPRQPVSVQCVRQAVDMQAAAVAVSHTGIGRLGKGDPAMGLDLLKEPCVHGLRFGRFLAHPSSSIKSGAESSSPSG